MITDPGFPGFPDGTRFPDQSVSRLPNQSFSSVPRFGTTYADHRYDDFRCNLADPRGTAGSAPENSGLTREEDPPEDCDFSDAVFRYINRMLMEEDMEDQACMLQESLDLQAAERSLYEAIGKKYPPSPEPNLACPESNGETLYHEFPGNHAGNRVDGGYYAGHGSLQSLRRCSIDFRNSQTRLASVPSISYSSYSSSNSTMTSVDGLDESPNSTPYPIPDVNGETQSVWLFRRGIEEASKFLPGGNELLVDFRGNGSLTQAREEMAVKEEANEENRKDNRCSVSGFRGRKTLNRDEVGVEEERSSKLPAVFEEPVLRSNVIDKVLVHVPGEDSMKEFNALRNFLKNGVEKKVVPQDGKRARGSNGKRGRGRRQNWKKEVVDLRALLIHCAQAIAADDRRTANELLKQIRQHSTPFGDGNQRLAHCFANGLDARLAGTGSQIYRGLVSKPRTAADILKAYHLFLACCPFRKLSNFLTNKTIKDLVGNHGRVHVIDFGILYGFQWPTLIQRFSLAKHGPPKIRITGIEFPQPGFRPAQRVEETGRRLAAYAEEFGVPFEYNAIAKKWDTIQLEELKIDRDEILVVNCLYRAENLHDETVRVESSRDAVLSLIRKINPDLFIHGIVNGAYNAPFFVTRFREALFHFSSIFDMLETIVPREDHERMLLEMEVFGREALNVIACEGWERVERPETYKQWQVRSMRSGFVQVPFDPNKVKDAMCKVKLYYHKDFVIDEDSRWVLQGWKGRTVMALSSWKPDSKV